MIMTIAVAWGAARPRLMMTKRQVSVAVALVAVLLVATNASTRRAYYNLRLRRASSRLVFLAPARPSSRLSSSAPPRNRIASRGDREDTSPPPGLYNAILSVSENAKGDPSWTARRAVALAEYHTGHFASAVRALEDIPDAARSPGDWNDLAAARLEIVRTASEPLTIVAALVAVNRALALEPGFPPALYNRAMTLEKMGLRSQALQAWRLCLVAESEPRWRDQIREHLARAATEPDEVAWKAVVSQLNADDAGQMREIVERFPQQARATAELLLPADWAKAAIANDPATAQSKLRLARALASAVQSVSGEPLAAESIAAIDSALANGDRERVARLANAQVLYLRGRLSYRDQDLVDAERTLRAAADAFAKDGSPMAGVAAYYAANAAFDQNRVDEAAALYASLATKAHQRGYHALEAQVAWQVARAEGIRAHWDLALSAATRGVAGFRALGEKENTGAMENMLAEVYDYLGQPERAWAHRLRSFDLLSAAGANYRLQVSLGAASRMFLRKQDWLPAIALLDVEVAASQALGNTELHAEAVARRARARAATGDYDHAFQDIELARTSASGLTTPALRANVEADIDASQGVIERARNPSESVRLLTKAISFFQGGSTILLPELFLERGRSLSALGRDEEALADFASGIGRLEVQRAAVSEFELYSTAVDVGEDLYVEAVRLAAGRHDAARAFEFSERGRGRALLRGSVAGRSKRTLSMETHPGVHLVEFMVLPEKVVAFTLDPELHMKVLDLRRDDLERMVGGLNAAITDRQQLAGAQAAGAALYDALLRPLGPATTKASTIAFVPNKVLERVPWAALYDRDAHRYLVEDTNVVLLPSADMLEAVTPARPSLTAAKAFIVGNPRAAPDFADFPPLPAAENEAKAIARCYPSRRILLGAEATRAHVVRLAKDYDVLHFAGHAVSSDVSEEQSFLLLAPDEMTGDSGVLYSRDIAELPLKNVRLVVLAACGTLRGSAVHLDGMPSIARSFLAAGAGAVIGTLWDIEDERSAPLFSKIHCAVAAGTPVAQAVHDAQIDAIRSGDDDVAHPKTWAGLVLVGGL